MSNIRPFTMPKWGIEMTEGTISEWMVKEGDAFKKGDLICLIETDKITNEVEAEFDAVLRKVVVETGTAYPVGALLGVYADAQTPQEEIDAFADAYKPAASAGSAGKQSAAPAAAAQPAERIATIETNRPISPEALKFAQDHGVDLDGIDGSGRNGRITYQDVHQASRPAAVTALHGPADLAEDYDAFFASPLAKRLAKMNALDLSGVKGTGPRGRIRKNDVLALMPAQARGSAALSGAPFQASPNPPRVVPMDRIRKVVARRLTQSKQEVPHFYLRMTVSVEALLALRKTANLVLGVKASINDYLIRACGIALADNPNVNIQVHGGDIHSFSHADIAVAVATDAGLVTPIVRGVDEMRVDQVASATAALIEKAKAGQLSHDDMEGGTFSISNLGMFGIDQFDAIINPPQGSILAVGGITRALVEGADGDGVFESQIGLSLSCDHRAIDGAVGATFMARLKELIEEPEALFP
ncbi:MAG: 2-oxo acid dehydrogenase subunit E2 [Pseudomonadota bacterium]